MSTDLQFRQLPAVIHQLPSLKVSISQLQHESSSSSATDSDQSECSTPTSPEHRIPAILTCPPPPKKQRKFIPSCKRRLHRELFFEVVAGDEIDSFFKHSYELINKNSSKKRK
ncbi:cyclin-dependent protein kinase inhibitor SMR2-like [Rutidosis leptorrhynchoides]|uniref:cyclin-dependent protein kinase inhibitor SMR2-like n=1 Tax=Rutidosis leptorrhynchoides TaxID=125765 RepID=UPI003A991667